MGDISALSFAGEGRLPRFDPRLPLPRADRRTWERVGVRVLQARMCDISALSFAGRIGLLSR